MSVSRDPVNIALSPGWNLISLPFHPPNPAINAVVNANHPACVVMTYDIVQEAWLASHRAAETGLFAGDVTVMTASTAYFIRTDSTKGLALLRLSMAATEERPPELPIIKVAAGWNLVPVISVKSTLPATIPAAEYFGTLGVGGWLKALTYNPVEGAWESVGPRGNDEVILGKGYWLYATAAGVIIP